MRFSDSVNDAVALLEAVGSPSYNVLHARGVVDLAANISSFYDADHELVEVACWWHDVGRIDGIKNHELLSASLAYENLSLHGFDRMTCSKVYDAIKFHRSVSMPKTLEAKIVRDADKLDLISVERWLQSIEFRDRGVISSLSDRHHAIKLIPKMRNSILSLEKSRVIFDYMIARFLDFLSTSNDEEVMACYNELVTKAVL